MKGGDNRTGGNGGGGGGGSGGDMKPLTEFAPPPISAVISTCLFVISAVWYMPQFDHNDIDANVFTRRIFPELISIQLLLSIRIFFTCICMYGFAMAWIYPP
jgi:hypothetical protein